MSVSLTTFEKAVRYDGFTENVIVLLLDLMKAEQIPAALKEIGDKRPELYKKLQDTRHHLFSARS